MLLLKCINCSAAGRSRHRPYWESTRQANWPRNWR